MFVSERIHSDVRSEPVIPFWSVAFVIIAERGWETFYFTTLQMAKFITEWPKWQVANRLASNDVG